MDESLLIASMHFPTRTCGEQKATARFSMFNSDCQSQENTISQCSTMIVSPKKTPTPCMVSLCPKIGKVLITHSEQIK